MNKPLNPPFFSASSLEQTLATLGYVRRFQGQTILIKIGGAALEDLALVRNLCEDIRTLQSVGLRIVLVHGGGASINQELRLRGINWEFVNGLRVTSPEMMEVIEMVLCGKLNHRIVRNLNRIDVAAVGLSGADANMLSCRQMAPELQQVGQIEKVHVTSIETVLPFAIPVIAPVGVGKGGEAFNINADWAAVRIAQAMKIKKVLFLTDQNGILDKQNQLIEELDAAELESLIEESTVKGGMLAKVQTILHALHHGIQDVHIMNARQPHALIEELFTNQGVGTVCRLRSLDGRRHSKASNSYQLSQTHLGAQL